MTWLASLLICCLLLKLQTCQLEDVTTLENLPTPSEAFPTFISFTRLREAPEEGKHGSIDGPELFQQPHFPQFQNRDETKTKVASEGSSFQQLFCSSSWSNFWLHATAEMLLPSTRDKQSVKGGSGLFPPKHVYIFKNEQPFRCQKILLTGLLSAHHFKPDTFIPIPL